MNKALEPIAELVQEAESRNFKATAAPYLDMKNQGGWCVTGIADFKKIDGGSSWTNAGWVFDNKADATNFYNHFSHKRNKEVLQNFFSRVKV